MLDANGDRRARPRKCEAGLLGLDVPRMLLARADEVI
jgi:hypothetical protein